MRHKTKVNNGKIKPD